VVALTLYTHTTPHHTAPHDSNCYSSYAVMVDEFMYNNPDSLVIFAAGNSGTQGDYSVVTPSTAKSCVTVGASYNVQQSSFGLENNINYVAYFSSAGPTADGRYVRACVHAHACVRLCVSRDVVLCCALLRDSAPLPALNGIRLQLTRSSLLSSLPASLSIGLTRTPPPFPPIHTQPRTSTG
jgi:hypothetical protein